MAWHPNNLTNRTGRRAVTDLAAHVNPNEYTKHVFFQGVNDISGAGDGHIHELWWDGDWHHNDLTNKTGAPLVSGSPSSYMFRGEGTQHVIYRGVGVGNSAPINELWWDGDWHHNDLTSAADNAPLTGISRYSPFGYEFSFGSPSFGSSISQNVVYETIDKNIHLLFWDFGWHHTALTAWGAGDPSLALFCPTAYVFTIQRQASQRVLYLVTDQHVHELMWNNVGPNKRQWQPHDLMVLTGAPPAVSRPIGLMHDLEFTLHVFYRSKDNHLYELWWNNLGWHVNDLTTLTGAPLAANGALAYVHLERGSLNVIYLGEDGHINLLVRDEGDAWNPANYSDLTVAAGGAPAPAGGLEPAGFLFSPPSGGFTQHIFYVSNTYDIIELTDEPTLPGVG